MSLYMPPCVCPCVLPEQVGGPDDGQVLGVHVGDGAEGGQAGKVPHQELQAPGEVTDTLIWACLHFN